MSDCCANSSTKTSTQTCPQCGMACKSVELRTLYHQVKFPDNQRIIPGRYYFCPSKECATAYFSSAGHNILKLQLTTHQGIKNDTLCYCFDIATADYLKAFKTDEADTIKNFVVEKTKSGDCACEIRNPSGQCCLAKFKQLQNGLDTK